MTNKDFLQRGIVMFDSVSLLKNVRVFMPMRFLPPTAIINMAMWCPFYSTWDHCNVDGGINVGGGGPFSNGLQV